MPEQRSKIYIEVTMVMMMSVVMRSWRRIMLRMRMHIRRRNYPLIGPLCCRFAGKAASDGQMVAALGFDPMQGWGMSAPEFLCRLLRLSPAVWKVPQSP